MSDVEQTNLTAEQTALIAELRATFTDEVVDAGQVRKYAVATIGKVLGQDIPEQSFAYTWLEYRNIDTAKVSKDWLGDKEIFETVNDIQSRNGLSGARAKVVNKYAESIRNTPEFKRSEFIKAAVAFGMSQEQAEQLAASKL